MNRANLFVQLSQPCWEVHVVRDGVYRGCSLVTVIEEVRDKKVQELRKSGKNEVIVVKVIKSVESIHGL